MFDMSSTSGYMVQNMFKNMVPYSFFDASSASGYMGAKHVQESGSYFLICPQLVGTWV